MNRILLTLALLIPVCLSAQTDYEKTYGIVIDRKNSDKNFYFSVGAKVQPAICWLESGIDSVESDGARAGFMYGFDMEFGFTPNIWMGLGVYHDIMGGNLKYLDRDTAGNLLVTRHNHNFQYIEVPFSMKFKTPQFGRERWNVWGKFGVSMGIHLNGQTRITTEQNGTTLSDTHLNTDNAFTLFRGSVLVGAGFEWSIIGKTRLVGGVLFNNGFSNILKEDLNNKAPTSRTDVGRLKYVEIVIGAMF